uniref:t-SNARE coiled-coil homology domain-containing protein n=1 Tax=Nelumbo nucifera TaxID=4432 RepID=A0A822YHQ4_NELNU|nr:TPA_asm: hypothetical protein HUJ06_009307 [Nelumbo nucifera]
MSMDCTRTSVTDELRKKLKNLMMNFQKLRQQMMAKYKEMEHRREKVIETVLKIQNMHDAVKEVEKSLLKLHQVFLDMVVMVEPQGEQLDDIQHYVKIHECY